MGCLIRPKNVRYSKIGIDQNDTAEHRQLALEVARQSLVLLKNDGILPLHRAKIKQIAVIGPNAESVQVLEGNYNGTPSQPVTILKGITNVAGPNILVTYAQGCPLTTQTGGGFGGRRGGRRRRPSSPSGTSGGSPQQRGRCRHGHLCRRH